MHADNREGLWTAWRRACRLKALRPMLENLLLLARFDALRAKAPSEAAP
ncbi:MAG: hypothetical protein U1F43_31790 [Myxococcota bacterium]